MATDRETRAAYKAGAQKAEALANERDLGRIATALESIAESLAVLAGENGRVTAAKYIQQFGRATRPQRAKGIIEDHDARKPHVTITRGIRGYYAVFLRWCEATEKHPGFWEPLNTGVGSYETAEEAAPEAIMWADAEGVEYRAPKDIEPPHPHNVPFGVPINKEGQYYADDGTLMNRDGSRSIFDDVDAE